MPDPAAVTRWRVIVEVTVAAVVLGLAAGAVWSILAPEVYGQVTSDGVVVRGAEARRQFGMEWWFAVTTGAAGLLLSVLAFARHRRQPVTTVLVLVVAGLGASAVAWRFGVLLGPGPLDDRAAGLDVGTRLTVPLSLHAPAVLLVWPIASAAGVAIVAAALEDRGRRRVNRSGRSWRSWRR